MKILTPYGRVHRVSADEARRIARDQECEWGGSLNRVRWLRPPLDRISEWERCYRNTEAPVIAVTPEWLRSVGY